MAILAPDPAETQRTLAEQIARAMEAAGFQPDEITEALADLPEAVRAARAPKRPRVLSSVGDRAYFAKLEQQRGDADHEEQPPAPRGQAAPVDPYTRRSSRAFLEACERAARAAGETWTPPPSIPRRIWIGAQAISQSGSTARHALAELPREYAARLRHAIRSSGETHGHITARLLVAYGWTVYRLSTESRRRGYARRVEGIPRGLFAAIVRNTQTGERYSVARLFGTTTNAGAGIFVQLERAGAFLKLQTPAHRAPARLKGPSGHAFNVYWIPTARALTRPDAVDAPPAPAGAPVDAPAPIAGAQPPP